MKFLRAFFKTLFTILATLFLYGCFAVGHLLLKLFSAETGKWRNYWLNLWGIAVCRIMAIRVHVVGKIPKPPFFLVSNHLSYADIMVYHKVLDTTFVAKAEIKNWPVIGSMAKTLGVIFIDRRRKSDVARVNNLVANQITSHKGVVLFPEGTTSSGEKILPFKPSILEHPAKSNMPVHYAYIDYVAGPKDEDAINSVCWWGDSTFGSHFFKFAGNRSTDAYIYFGDQPVKRNDRKELAAELHQRVKDLHQNYSSRSEMKNLSEEVERSN